jgi:hypothetical protein
LFRRNSSDFYGQGFHKCWKLLCLLLVKR